MAMLQSLLILLVVFTMSNAGVDRRDDREGRSRCPNGWKRFRSQCYKYFSDKVKWIKAERKCEDLGGHLASVSDKRENDFLLNLVPTSTRCWIGANDGVEDGEWLWSDGSLSHYTNWCSGEPNNFRGPEDCVEINFTGNHCWNDVSCSVKISYICAKDQ